MLLLKLKTAVAVDTVKDSEEEEDEEDEEKTDGEEIVKLRADQEHQEVIEFQIPEIQGNVGENVEVSVQFEQRSCEISTNFPFFMFSC